ncbi:MAG: hypothetical protein IAI50_16375 [Candidatus Eremiobacteraeota bacterium]|nr:hypothetical protein [Candidatus Eremiobacteraeota bacterium]
MKYLGTSFSLTLGAWRLRFSFDVEDAPDDRTMAMQHVRRVSEGERARERA